MGIISLYISLIFRLFFPTIFGNTDNNTIESRVENMSFFISVEMNSTVKKYINGYFVNPQEAQNLLSRSYMYFPVVEDQLRANNLPDDLKYLTVIESHLLEEARSPAQAAGLWQMVSLTAKHYGLRVDSEVDERLNVYTSSSAAIKYIQELYRRFGDWSLALYAYNCGPTYLQKVMNEVGTSDPKVLLNYLPKETEIYLDKLLAAKYFFSHYKAHNIVFNPPSPKEYVTSTLQIGYNKTSFDEISSSFGVDVVDLNRLNKHVKNPNSFSNTTIVMPYYRGKNSFFELVQHTLPAGQTLADIANFLNISTSYLSLWNNNSISNGQQLAFFVPSDLKDKFESMFRISVDKIENNTKQAEVNSLMVPTLIKESPVSKTPKVEYVVQKHESLADIAWLFDMRVEDLESINPNMDFRPGATIFVYQK